MNAPVALQGSPSNIVYVKPIAITELPPEVQAQAIGLEKLYAVHNDAGERLALVADERMAFALARENDLAPVQLQ
ncbi:DUF1150 family protein [Primorskyibacter sp. S187A]|uniref:DUF1150 family protein n=1 Tax=Primorskyibacter sp. S187A TaxID=3415130 RepID=UPI003C7EC0D4